MAMFTRDEVLAMERAAARAWPAACVEQVAGWDVRLSGGGSRRANSVLPLDFDGTAVDKAIARVEELYRASGTRSYFQVSSIASPDDLDLRLDGCGYGIEEPTLLMAKRLASGPMPVGIDVKAEPSAQWLSVYTESLDASRRAAAPAVLASVPSPRGFLLATSGGAPLSGALAVLSSDGLAVVECVATRADARRTGGGQAIMDALEAWSFANGARTAILQVTERNSPARALYDRRGYTLAGRYHYRWKDV